MYNLFFFLVLAVIVELVINEGSQRYTQYIVRSLMILLGTIIPIVVLFMPKFTKAIYMDSDNVGSSGSNKQSTPNPGGQNSFNANTSTKSTGHFSTTVISSGEVESSMESAQARQIERLKLQVSRLKTEVKNLRAENLKLRGEDV